MKKVLLVLVCLIIAVSVLPAVPGRLMSVSLGYEYNMNIYDIADSIGDVADDGFLPAGIHEINFTHMGSMEDTKTGAKNVFYTIGVTAGLPFLSSGVLNNEELKETIGLGVYFDLNFNLGIGYAFHPGETTFFYGFYFYLPTRLSFGGENIPFTFAIGSGAGVFGGFQIYVYDGFFIEAVALGNYTPFSKGAAFGADKTKEEDIRELMYHLLSTAGLFAQLRISAGYNF